MTLEPEHILIIDDEEVVTDVLTEYLNEKGFLASASLSGGDGIDIAGRVHIDLVVLDKNLPDMSWEKAAEGIWEQSRRRVPIIMITGYPSMESVIDAYRLGITRYLEKPLDLDRIKKAIHETLLADYLRRGFEEQIENTLPRLH